MRTVVVGNGIVALTAALALARRGGEVVVVGDPARTGSATLAAAAMLSAFGEIEAGALATAAGRAKLALACAASAAWPRLATELGVAHAAGTYVIDDGPDVAAMLAALAEHGEPHAVVAAAEVPGYAGGGRRAVRIDREGWVDPRAVLAALDRAVAAAGAEMIAGVARGVSARGVVLADGRVIAGSHYLLAPGATLTALLAASDLALAVPRVRYGIGTTLELAPIAGHGACLRAHGVYSVPHGDRLVLGATNLVADAPADDATAVQRIRDAAARLDPRFARAEVLRANVGWRPTTDDGYPLIGATRVPNVAIATGTRRDGFHLAPVIAEHLAAVLHGEAGDPRFAAFAPERDALQ